MAKPNFRSELNFPAIVFRTSGATTVKPTMKEIVLASSAIFLNYWCSLGSMFIIIIKIIKYLITISIINQKGYSCLGNAVKRFKSKVKYLFKDAIVVSHIVRSFSLSSHNNRLSFLHSWTQLLVHCLWNCYVLRSQSYALQIEI